MTAAHSRADYITGLRMLADLLEANPDLQLPYGAGTSGEMASDRVTFYSLSGDDPKGDLARMARLIPGTVRKEVDGDVFRVVGQLAGLHLEAVAYRNAVCERVVTGTRTVTVTEPDPDALAAVPTVERTVEVEDVEWVCAPILADATSEPVMA